MENQVEVKQKRKYVKKEIAGNRQGRFFVVENLTAESISFRNPYSEENKRSDITIAGYASEVVDDFWRDVAWFVRAENDGLIRAYYSDTLPVNLDLTVTGTFDLRGDRLLDAQALSIVKSPKFDQTAKERIMVNPRKNDLIDRDWLKEKGYRFLNNIIAREKKFRNRTEVIELCQKRLLEIQAL